jgi:hypothetical protein
MADTSGQDREPRTFLISHHRHLLRVASIDVGPASVRWPAMPRLNACISIGLHLITIIYTSRNPARFRDFAGDSAARPATVVSLGTKANP